MCNFLSKCCSLIVQFPNEITQQSFQPCFPRPDKLCQPRSNVLFLTRLLHDFFLFFFPRDGAHRQAGRAEVVITPFRAGTFAIAEHDSLPVIVAMLGQPSSTFLPLSSARRNFRNEFSTDSNVLLHDGSIRRTPKITIRIALFIEREKNRR